MRTGKVRVSVGQQEQSVSPLWFANHETGDFSQWQIVSNSGQATNKISTEQARSGQYSAKLCIFNVTSVATKAGTRLTENGRKWGPNGILPVTAYYSVWYWFPQKVTVLGHWNIYQWKQAWWDGSRRGTDPVYAINGHNRADGTLCFRLHGHVGADGGYDTPGGNHGSLAVAPAGVNIQLQQWVHLESLYTWDRNGNGQLRSWQDGVELWKFTNIITEFDEPEYLAAFEENKFPRTWTVNNYSNGTDPHTHCLYVDDAVIASERVYGKTVIGS